MLNALFQADTPPQDSSKRQYHNQVHIIGSARHANPIANVLDLRRKGDNNGLWHAQIATALDWLTENCVVRSISCSSLRSASERVSVTGDNH